MRRTERASAWAGYVGLAVVGACVVAMSWRGLVGFAEDILDIPRPWSVMVPISLDGVVITCAFFGLRSTLAGDAGIFPRALAWIVVAAGSAANYYHATVVGSGEAAALYFAGMTALVYLLFEVILRQLRRNDLRAQGATEPPLARFRLVRWGRFPLVTFRAWSQAVRYGLTDPAEALRLAGVERPQLDRVEVLDLRTVDDLRAELEAPPTPPRRQLPARNGTSAAGRIRELVEAGAVTVEDILAREPGLSRDTVARTLRRIHAERTL